MAANELGILAGRVDLAIKLLTGNGEPRTGLMFQIAMVQQDVAAMKLTLAEIQDQLRRDREEELAELRRELAFWRARANGQAPITLTQSQVSERRGGVDVGGRGQLTSGRDVVGGDEQRGSE